MTVLMEPGDKVRGERIVCQYKITIFITLKWSKSLQKLVKFCPIWHFTQEFQQNKPISTHFAIFITPE